MSTRSENLFEALKKFDYFARTMDYFDLALFTASFEEWRIANPKCHTLATAELLGDLAMQLKARGSKSPCVLLLVRTLAIDLERIRRWADKKDGPNHKDKTPVKIYGTQLHKEKVAGKIKYAIVDTLPDAVADAAKRDGILFEDDSLSPVTTNTTNITK